MKELRLRHHHLICARMFIGRGYDSRFVANMEKVVSALCSTEELMVRLGVSCDDICSHCPNAEGGRCRDHDSVAGKDRSAARFLGLPEEVCMPAGKLLERVEGSLDHLDDVHVVCGECEWAELCNERLRGARAQAGHPGTTGKNL